MQELFLRFQVQIVEDIAGFNCEVTFFCPLFSIFFHRGLSPEGFAPHQKSRKVFRKKRKKKKEQAF
jgi:hypothetical protein